MNELERGATDTGITIVPFTAAHGAAFDRLNRAWLVDHGIFEPPDEAQLRDPFGTIIAQGGAIFVAMLDGDVVGTAAIVPHAGDEMELVKLTVSPTQRGQGLGRRLIRTCIDAAIARSASRLVLVSSSRLTSALRLYESLGFERRPLPSWIPYQTADIYMELIL